MSDPKIQELNKMIALFMGYVYVPSNDERVKEYTAGWYKKDPSKVTPMFTKLVKDEYLCRSHNGLRFPNDWNWLMEVVEKIEKLDLSNWYDEDNFTHVNVSIESGHCYIFVELNFDPGHRITGESNYNKKKIHLVYDQVVNFIKWYNARMVEG